MAINDEAFDKIEGEIPIVNALSLSSKKTKGWKLEFIRLENEPPSKEDVALLMSGELKRLG